MMKKEQVHHRNIEACALRPTCIYVMCALSLHGTPVVCVVFSPNLSLNTQYMGGIPPFEYGSKYDYY